MTDQHDATSDVHALSGAYAVDALDPDERVRFEEHLRDCPTCAAEVDSLREATAALAADADVEPPPSLRAGVLAGIQSVRPLPPVTGSRGSTVRALPTRRRLLGLGGPQLLMAAAAVVVAGVVGAVWWQPWAGEDDPALSATEQVLTASDAVRSTQRFPDSSSATVVVSRAEGRAVIVTEDMAPAPQGKDYQIWLQTPEGELQPAGLMPDDPDTTLLLDGDASAATGVGITVEPDGGSRQPTTEPIALFEIES